MANIKKTPGINAASMADISFILFIFFLMVTTMGTDFGLIRQLPPIVPQQDDKTRVDIKERNVLVVAVNQNNALLVEKEYLSVMDLRQKTKEFYDIHNTGDEFPEKETIDIPLLGTVTRNKGAVVSLQNDRGTSYKTYIAVQNELAGAIHELRNEFSMQKFAKQFDDLNKEEQEAVSKVYPMSISEAEPKNIGGN